MKNFLEALDTNLFLNCSMEIDCIKENGNPFLDVIIDQKKIYSGEVLRKIFIKERISVHKPFRIVWKMSKKKYNIEKETAIIVKLKIDNINIIPNFNHHLNYINDHSTSITSNYMGFNGELSLNIDKPFYQWYHSISWQGMAID